MDEILEKKIEALKLRTRTDHQYRKLEKKLLWLECEFSDIVNELPDEQQDLVWEFVLLSNRMDRYLLEAACMYIDPAQLQDFECVSDPESR